jgi:hypothetical protein
MIGHWSRRLLQPRTSGSIRAPVLGPSPLGPTIKHTKQVYEGKATFKIYWNRIDRSSTELGGEIDW